MTDEAAAEFDESDCRHLGVHIAAGKAFLALRVSPGVLDDNSVLRRVERSTHMDMADALLDFMTRFQQIIRGCRPCGVSLLETRNYQPSSYTEAFNRASVASAIMIAVRSQSIPFRLVKQGEVARQLGLTGHFKSQELVAAASALLPERPKYWTDRCLAYATAAAVAAGADCHGHGE